MTEESRNNRLNNKTLLFMGTSRENSPTGVVGAPRIAHTANKIPCRGAPDFLQIRMGKGFSSTNFVQWINGVERIQRDSRPGPIPTRNVTSVPELGLAGRRNHISSATEDASVGGYSIGSDVSVPAIYAHTATQETGVGSFKHLSETASCLVKMWLELFFSPKSLPTNLCEPDRHAFDHTPSKLLYLIRERSART